MRHQHPRHPKGHRHRSDKPRGSRKRGRKDGHRDRAKHRKAKGNKHRHHSSRSHHGRRPLDTLKQQHRPKVRFPSPPAKSTAYLLAKTPVSWHDAPYVCQAHGYDLAYLDKHTAHQVIGRMAHSGTKAAWFGHYKGEARKRKQAFALHLASSKPLIHKIERSKVDKLNLRLVVLCQYDPRHPAKHGHGYADAADVFRKEDRMPYCDAKTEVCWLKGGKHGDKCKRVCPLGEDILYSKRSRHPEHKHAGKHVGKGKHTGKAKGKKHHGHSLLYSAPGSSSATYSSSSYSSSS